MVALATTLLGMIMLWPEVVRRRVSRQLVSSTWPSTSSMLTQSDGMTDRVRCRDIPASRLLNTPCRAKPTTAVTRAVEASRGEMSISRTVLNDYKSRRHPKHGPHDGGEQLGDWKGTAPQDKHLAGDSLDQIKGQDNRPERQPGSEVVRDLEKTFLHPGVEAEYSQQQLRNEQHGERPGHMADKVLAELQQAPIGVLMAGYGPAKRSGNGIGDG